MLRFVSFNVPGTPKGKARARTVYNKNTKQYQSYTPDNTVLYENLIRTTYTQKFGKLRVSAGIPVEINIVSTFEPAASVSKAQRIKMLAGTIKPTKKPDLDNIAKVVLDALNGLAFYDDSQVIWISAKKEYGEEAGLFVRIGWEEDDDTERSDT